MKPISLDLRERILATYDAGAATGEAVILHRHPLVASARKVRLYSLREPAWFFLRATFNQRDTLTNRAACHPWYDGRR